MPMSTLMELARLIVYDNTSNSIQFVTEQDPVGTRFKSRIFAMLLSYSRQIME